MVRYFNYNIPQKDVLSYCQSALQNLGYEIASYDPEDYHLYTIRRTISHGLMKADYIVYINVEDRIQLYIYAETRVFRRASEMGIFAGEQIQIEASDRLKLGFQDEIFNPLVNELKNYGFIEWKYDTENKIDDKEIRNIEKKLDEIELRNRNRQILINNEKKRISEEEYQLEREEARTVAIDEIQSFIEFSASNDTSILKDWSIVAISREVNSHKDDIRDIIKSVVNDYSDYTGDMKLKWIINPEGRVVDVEIAISTTPFIPDMEIIQSVSSNIHLWNFSREKSRNRFIEIELPVRFYGNYHNIKFQFEGIKANAVYNELPLVEKETVNDTFFIKKESTIPR